MSKQKAFFLSEWEILQRDHPEKFARKTGTREKKPPKVYDCTLCGLDKKCRNPKIKRFGKGQKDILFVGLCPGQKEDRKGIPFVGRSGALLDETCSLLDLNLDRDCIRTNIVQCYPGYDKVKRRDKEPSKDQIKCCRPNLERDIQEVQPKLIICLGTEAIKAVLKFTGSYDFSASLMHGRVIPYHKLNCWVGGSYHPSFFLRRKNRDDVPDDDAIFAYDFAKILNYLDTPLPQPLTSEGNECISDVDEAVAMIEHFCDSEDPVSFDYECNKLSPYHENSKIVSVSLTNEDKSAIFIPIALKDKEGNLIFNDEEQVKILCAMRNFLKSDAPKLVQNYYMEELWGREITGQSMNNFVWDTMVTAHVVNCNVRSTGLAFQALELTGHEYKKMVDVAKIEDEPVEKVCDYNCWDVRYSLMSYHRQKSQLGGRLEEFNKFFHKGLLTLANLKHRGIKIDQKQLGKIKDDFSSGMDECLRIVNSSEGVEKYNEENKKPFEITSSAQIGKVLYDIYGVELTKKRQTPTGKGGTAEGVLQEILEETKDPKVKNFITPIFKYRKNTKVIERVEEYRRLVDPNWFVHPTFNLNVARSYRSSCDGPNIQNVFTRDDEQRTFRRCIVPRPGNFLLSGDYDGMEVKVIGMVSGDPELCRQIKLGLEWDKSHPEGGKNPFDTHYKWAGEVYQKSIEEITDKERYYCKNGFLFPSVYGSVPASMARYEGFVGILLEHLKQVQEKFWEEYHYVKEWQLRTIRDYKINGYVELVTGARRPGPLNINKIYNTPIQGPAYHLLQDALNRIDEALLEIKTITFPIAEIHDDIIFDTYPDELEDVRSLAEEIMISKRFEWQRDVPLSVSWEVGQKNWWAMKKLKLKE